MKRKLETSIKQLPKLFQGKRTSSEREGEEDDSAGAAPSEPAPARQNAAAQRTSFFSRVKSTGRTPPVDINAVVSSPLAPSSDSAKAASKAPPLPPAKDPSLSAQAPNRATSIKIDAGPSPSVVPPSSAPPPSTSIKTPVSQTTQHTEVPLPAGGSLDTLDDFSLRRLLDKRLFVNELSGVEVVLAIRLSSSAPVTAQIASSLSRVLSKDEKKKKDVLLVFTRSPEFRIHGVAAGSNVSMLSISWSFPLQTLLALRETKRGVVVLQFIGGKERKIVPVSEAEKGWLFYGVTRLSREFLGTDPTIIAFSSIRLIASEESLNARCPFLVSEAVLSKTDDGNKKAGTASKPKGDIAYTYDFGSFLGEDEDGDADEEAVTQALSRQKGSTLIVTDEEAKSLNRIFVSKTVQDTPDDLISRSRAQLVDLEKETLAELRAWESGQGPAIAKKSVTDVDTGRRGDPIASLLAHLEDVEVSLKNLDDWMNAHDSSVLGMTTIARRIDSEIKNLREEGIAKERLAGHLKELLEDLSPEDDQILSEMSALLPIIQRELEAYQTQHPIALKMVRALRSLVAFRERGGADSRIAARRDRYKRMKDKTSVAATKLSDFFQSRFDYYYKYERGDVREAHGRLVTYGELLSCLSALSPAHFNQVNARYQAEAGLFTKSELTKLMDAYFTSPIPSNADSLSKYPDGSLLVPADSGNTNLETLRYEREVAVKEVHMAGVESRRRFISRLRSIIREEDGFCQAVGHGFDFTQGLVFALDGIWQTIANRAQTFPVSFAAPLVCDMERLAAQFEADEKVSYSAVILERMVARFKDVLDRFLVDQVAVFFDKAKRSHAIFVKKYPGLIDRLDAAGRGFEGDEEESARGGGKETTIIAGGIRTVTKSVMQLIAAQTNPVHRLENLFFLVSSISARCRPSSSSLRGGGFGDDNLRSTNGAVVGEILSDMESKLEAAMRDTVATMIESSAFASAVRLMRASEDEEDFSLTKMELDEALSQLQNGAAERSVQQIRASIEAKVTLSGKLRTQVLEATRDSVVESYWRLAEMAAESFGTTVQPSPSAVKDIWVKLMQH